MFFNIYYLTVFFGLDFMFNTVKLYFIITAIGYLTPL